MYIGLDKDGILSEAYAPEFYARVKLMEKLHAPVADYGQPEPYVLDYYDVQARIGLKTNAKPVTRAAFLKNINVDHDLGRGLLQRQRTQNPDRDT